MSVEVVRQVKADLEARGISLVGPCGAFAITKRVAWALKSTGAGLLSKPNGNNCEGYATDIICYSDGEIKDILVNGGGDEDEHGNPIPGTGNGPTWAPPSDGQPVSPNRWRAPVDPGDIPAPVSTGPAAPIPTIPFPIAAEPSPDKELIIAGFASVLARIDLLEHNMQAWGPVVKEIGRILGIKIPK